MRTKAKSGFTIIELLTVISLILLLMGAVTASVTGARRRAKIQQAITEAQQLTDAILGYENFGRPGSSSPLEDKKTEQSWKVATEGDMSFVLGKDKNPSAYCFNYTVSSDYTKDNPGDSTGLNSSYARVCITEKNIYQPHDKYGICHSSGHTRCGKRY